MKPIKTKLEIVSELPIERLSKYAEHRRLKVFFHKGLECSNDGCTRTGTRLVKTKERNGTIHVDVFSDDGIMMNVDHFIPKSKHGTNHLLNLFPMCAECNNSKGNELPDTSHLSPDELTLMWDKEKYMAGKPPVKKRTKFTKLWCRFVKSSSFEPKSHSLIVPFPKHFKRDLQLPV